MASYSLQQEAFWLSWDAEAVKQHNLRGKGKYIFPRCQKYHPHYMHLFVQLQVTSLATHSPGLSVQRPTHSSGTGTG